MKLTASTHTPSHEIPCPSCHETVHYYRFGGMGELYPHFYCDACSNAFFSPGQHERVRSATIDASLLEAIEADLPACPCGGRFRPGANPKCPRCTAEIPHQAGPVERLTDPFLILVESASLLRPAGEALER